MDIYAGATADYLPKLVKRTTPPTTTTCPDCAAVHDTPGTETSGYELVPAKPGDKGPIFTLRTLDFWQAQDVIDRGTPVLERMRKAMQFALVAIDGDAANAAKFIAAPNPKLGNAVFDAVIDLASGN